MTLKLALGFFVCLLYIISFWGAYYAFDLYPKWFVYPVSILTLYVFAWAIWITYKAGQGKIKII